MIRPTVDVATINHFANHPEIRPGIGGHGYLDLGVIAAAPHVALFGEHGGFLASWSAPSTYEIHTLITEAGRGSWAFDNAEMAAQYMWGQGADHLWTRVHPDARHTAIFTRKMGFRPCGTNMLDIGDGPVEWRLFNRRHQCQRFQQ